jgi:putative ABC transport system substrate-binding protein
MKRRRFISSVAGAAAAMPLAAIAQRSTIPIVGFVRSSPAASLPQALASFRAGLKEAGLVEGRSVIIEQRYADNKLGRLPVLVAELIERGAVVIAGNTHAVRAAKKATTNVPIVFVVGDDPLHLGLVSNLSRPGGNLTGITFFGGGWGDAKRMELLQELVPGAKLVAALRDSNHPGSEATLPDIIAVARAGGQQVMVVKAANADQLEPAIAKAAAAHAEALLVSGSAFFTSQRKEIVALAARHALPAIYDVRAYVAAGGLMSYAASISKAYRQAGVYAARIVQGAKPGELPVMQPTTLELVVNLKTAQSLGIEVAPSILVRADEIIE